MNRAENIKDFLRTGKEVEASRKRKHQSNAVANPSAISSLSALALSHPELLAQIKGSILVAGSGVSMDDVIGLDAIKKDLDETIRLPMLFPRIMADRGMNNTLLLFGVSFKA